MSTPKCLASRTKHFPLPLSSWQTQRIKQENNNQLSLATLQRKNGPKETSERNQKNSKDRIVPGRIQKKPLFQLLQRIHCLRRKVTMPSSLSKMITSEQWDRVSQLCQGSPGEAKKWTTRQGFFEGMKDANVLPIHEALVAGAPFNIIQALLEAYPDCVFCKESSYQRLPLHCACRKNAVPEVVDLLLKKYADASLTPDSLGRLPRKFILCCACVTHQFS